MLCYYREHREPSVLSKRALDTPGHFCETIDSVGSIKNSRCFRRELSARVSTFLAALAETHTLNTLDTLRESSWRKFTNALPISLAHAFFIDIYLYFNTMLIKEYSSTYAFHRLKYLWGGNHCFLQTLGND